MSFTTESATRRHHNNVIKSPKPISFLISLFVVLLVLRSHAFQSPAPHRAVLGKRNPINICGRNSLCGGQSAGLSSSCRNIILYGTKHSSDKISDTSDQISRASGESRLEKNDCETLKNEPGSKELYDDEETLEDEELENIKLETEEKIEKEAVAQQVSQEKEELQAAVQEVKEAVVEVSQSAKNLGDAVINHGPGIFSRFFSLLVSEEMRNDVRRRRKHYISDWTDAFQKKRQVIPAVLFLYFACLAPAVSFGTISSEITNGSIGVVEFLLSSGVSGMLYSILSGQPMAFLAPTGLTLAFISGLFRFCSIRNLPFFPVYAWVGLWTSAFMTILGLSGSSKLIRFCTRFTDEVFNGLLSINFIYEAMSSLKRNFDHADPMNLTMPFVALSMALGTFFSTMTVVKFEATKFFNSKIRTAIKNFGPVSIILLFTMFNTLPWCQKFRVPTLSVPDTFQLAGGRSFLVALKDIPMNVRMLCALPACLLTCLFFMDQNISVRLVNNPDNKLKKGEAYNLDMVALGLITGGLSVFGLPWMCGATVQSMNHVRAMAETKLNEETKQMEIARVTETRVTGFTIHALLASTILLLPLIKKIPIPVVSGVFLFLGRKLMTGNKFFKRITDAFAEAKRLPDDNPIHLLGRKKMNVYTGVQVLCLIGLFGFKQIPSITIFFPAMIAILMFIRSLILPNFFNEDEFVALGDPTPS
eukprot:CAMPEP_0171342382 /NCGR_PEP_ID=MMETSP0878-20121228/14208_1 /TAXON_ID=67004 /ORGANISM="Thalassiosira weissflogii, Strain CCMP1336" /LENGTH=701 /DNA_ID=CAMNT_0011845031 /DNA_START=279 /DNA_END=2384 /DNA_ORIENTATION=-